MHNDIVACALWTCHALCEVNYKFYDKVDGEFFCLNAITETMLKSTYIYLGPLAVIRQFL